MALHTLVGDIGATKSTWYWDGPNPTEIQLPGYNPLQADIGAGRQMLERLAGHLREKPVGSIWYYGAGVAGPELRQQVADLLRLFFPGAVTHVQSDLLGAARAACGNAGGCVVILGTGSHAAVYDGQGIVRQANALGYLLGDEGSGCDIGKALLRAFFYGEMPDHLSSLFANWLPGGRSAFLRTLSAAPAPNQLLASFARFAGDAITDPWISTLVRNRFAAFIRCLVLPLDPPGPIHVVGSVGCIFGNLFAAELSRAGLSAGEFIRDPARALFELHYRDGREHH